MRPRAYLSLKSVRVRLALWNVGVLAAVLVGLGLVFSVSMRANISAAVDKRLSQQAHRIQRHFADMPPEEAASFLSRHPAHPSLTHGGTGGTAGVGPPRWFGGPPPASSPPPREDDAFGELRPRFFDLNGVSSSQDERVWDRRTFGHALTGDESYATIHSGGDVIRVFSAPLIRNGRTIAVVQCGNSLAHLQAEETRTTRTLLTLIPLVLLVAGLGGAFLTDRALRPVRSIAQEANKIEAENLSRRLPVTGDDEFADLAETFNGMLARLQRAFERQEEAFEQQRRFTADASHELRTPLTIIKANTSLALSGTRTGPELLKTVQTVNTAADRMNRIVQDLLLLARSDAGQLAYALTPIPLAEVVAQAVAGLSQPDGPHVVVTLSPFLRVQGNFDALIRLFGNLLENASRYTTTEGRITVSAEVLGDVVAVKVADTGEGIAAEHLPHLTERFYRVEAARSRPKGGTGLGLAICRSIVDAHGGELAIESTLGKGTVVRVTLPLGIETETALPTAPATPAALTSVG